MPILTTNGLECGYDETLLGPLDLSIPEGVFMLVEGPNGIGKSTLLKTLVGLVPARAGDIDWSVDPAAIRFVPQVRTLDPILPATVGDVVATGTQRGSRLAEMRVSMAREERREALERVGMAEDIDDLFRELSEGQKQLVLLARALAGSARVALLDEPAASMDPDKERRAVSLLRRACDERNLTVFIVAHGSDRAREAADARLTIDEDREVDFHRDGFPTDA